MDCRVCRIDKLPRNKAVRDFLRKLISLCYSAFHSLCALGENNFRTVCLKNISALHTHRLRHCKNNAIALRRSDCRKADTCISGCRLNNNRVFFQKSLCLGVLNHGLCNSVLYAARRIKIFKLNKDCCLQSELFFNVYDLHKRRISDKSKCSLINFRHDVYLLSFYFMAAKPPSRSLIISSICSVPIERRIVFGLIP